MMFDKVENENYDELPKAVYQKQEQSSTTDFKETYIEVSAKTKEKAIDGVKELKGGDE